MVKQVPVKTVKKVATKPIKATKSTKPKGAVTKKPVKAPKSTKPKGVVTKKPVKAPKSTKPKRAVSKKAHSKPVAIPEAREVPLRPKLDDRLLTLSFLRDGDEFCVRLELANGQITEFKNRSPDQLLTMVAGELEDLLG